MSLKSIVTARTVARVLGGGIGGYLTYEYNRYDYHRKYTNVPTSVLIAPTAIGSAFGAVLYPLPIFVGCVVGLVCTLDTYDKWSQAECERVNSERANSEQANSERENKTK